MTNIADLLGDEFEPLHPTVVAQPRFLHKVTGIPFQFVPAGTYRMGFSEDEERAALALSPVLHANVEEMRPMQEVSIGALLVSAVPVLNKHVSPGIDSYANSPAFFQRENAERFAANMGFRLPREREWEYFCRAGTKTLFPFGDQLANDEELEKWLSCDFASEEGLHCNNFGLYGIFNPEWCQEKFTIGLAKDAPLLDGSYVIRGGGAYFWPWQDEEWVWCMSAMRSPSSGLENGEACLRLVFDVAV